MDPDGRVALPMGDGGEAAVHGGGAAIPGRGSALELCRRRDELMIFSFSCNWKGRCLLLFPNQT